MKSKKRKTRGELNRGGGGVGRGKFIIGCIYCLTGGEIGL